MKISKKISTNFKFKATMLAISATLAGTVNGFLGTGGGIVLMMALNTFAADKDTDTKDIFSTVIAVILPLSLISLYFYREKFDITAAADYLLPGIAGGVAGAFLLDKIKVGVLKKLFAVMVIWAGINFIG